jgi:3,4-dihydroxy 2-butanone 4-phosphate synthase/GTP cyclohydrolase II
MNARTPLTPVPVAPVEEIVARDQAGRMVILVDEEDRENEGDLVLAADHVSPKRSTSWPASAAA